MKKRLSTELVTLISILVIPFWIYGITYVIKNYGNYILITLEIIALLAFISLMVSLYRDREPVKTSEIVGEESRKSKVDSE